MSTKFDWQNEYRKSHADLCSLESRNYVLEQRIKALEGCIRRINSMNDHPGWFRKELDEMIEKMGLSHDTVFEALGEE